MFIFIVYLIISTSLEVQPSVNLIWGPGGHSNLPKAMHAVGMWQLFFQTLGCCFCLPGDLGQGLPSQAPMPPSVYNTRVALPCVGV